MKLQNEFSVETRELFIWNKKCFKCGDYGWDVLHHVMGRESNSAFNACPIHNFKCHIGAGDLGKIEGRLLDEIRSFLYHNGYNFIDTDKEFYRKYKDLYTLIPKFDRWIFGENYENNSI